MRGSREAMASKSMSLAKEVVMVDFWCNEFGMRARVALRELGVAFRYVEEDLRVRERGDLVKRMNPVLRQIPILIHGGRPVCGSMNIVEYVDDAFAGAGRRLLPGDPLERANARFWAGFVDHKVFGAQDRFFKAKGEEKEAAKAELMEHWRRLEGVLGKKAYFGGDEFGFLDIAVVPFSSLFHTYEKHGRVDMETECPQLMQWVQRCWERESVRTVLPLGKDMYDIHKAFYPIE